MTGHAFFRLCNALTRLFPPFLLTKPWLIRALYESPSAFMGNTRYSEGHIMSAVHAIRSRNNHPGREHWIFHVNFVAACCSIGLLVMQAEGSGPGYFLLRSQKTLSFVTQLSPTPSLYGLLLYLSDKDSRRSSRGSRGWWYALYA